MTATIPSIRKSTEAHRWEAVESGIVVGRTPQGHPFIALWQNSDEQPALLRLDNLVPKNTDSEQAAIVPEHEIHLVSRPGLHDNVKQAILKAKNGDPISDYLGLVMGRCIENGAPPEVSALVIVYEGALMAVVSRSAHNTFKPASEESQLDPSPTRCSFGRVLFGDLEPGAAVAILGHAAIPEPIKLTHPLGLPGDNLAEMAHTIGSMVGPGRTVSAHQISPTDGSIV